MSTFIEIQRFTFESLSCGSCGVWFALTSDMHSSMKQGNHYHCPNGHSITYGRTEAQKLREQLDAKERELRASKCETLSERRLREEKELALNKAERKLKRVGRGVCPCCQRTFKQLAAHMAVKHPEFTERQG